MLPHAQRRLHSEHSSWKELIMRFGNLVAGAIGLLVLTASSHAQDAAPGDARAASATKSPSEKPGATTEDRSIRPFHFTASEEALSDLRRRIAATRWPEKETVSDASQGVQLATMQKLAQYWATDYDWRKCEAKLNALPQFITT